MADTRGRGVGACDDRCGCAVPCHGGTTCRCSDETSGASSGGRGDHETCSCGEHCGCNPCTCPKSVVSTGTGKAFCKCGDGCACAACRT